MQKRRENPGNWCRHRKIFDSCEFEQLFEGRNVEYLKTVAVDSILELAEDGKGFVMSDSDFQAFAK